MNLWYSVSERLSRGDFCWFLIRQKPRIWLLHNLLSQLPKLQELSKWKATWGCLRLCLCLCLCHNCQNCQRYQNRNPPEVVFVFVTTAKIVRVIIIEGHLRLALAFFHNWWGCIGCTWSPRSKDIPFPPVKNYGDFIRSPWIQTVRSL